jgi:hypothetical protein
MSGCEFCGIEDLGDWRHAEKSPTMHVIWARTHDGFTVGARAWRDPYGMMFDWRIQRTGSPANAGSGAAGSALSGLWSAMKALEEWRETLARAKRGVGFNPLPALVEEVPF